MNNTIKIFLASSSQLVKDRRDFELFISRKNATLIENNVYLKLVIWEDFLDAISPTRLQDEYNKAIRECDIFVLLFFTKVGRHSLEEFKTALASFKATGSPRIFTYFKDADIRTGKISEEIISLVNLRKELKKLGHYYTLYENNDALTLHFSKQLEKLSGEGYIFLGDHKTSAHAGDAPNYRRGFVLYQIPEKMQILKDTTCIVRIALDEILLVTGLEKGSYKTQEGIRLSDFMEVSIIDPNESKAFQIRTTTKSLVQLVDADDFSQWKFYVKPMIEGEHHLEINVFIIVMKEDGTEGRREKTFDKSIVVVAEAVAEESQFVKVMDIEVMPDESHKDNSSDGTEDASTDVPTAKEENEDLEPRPGGNIPEADLGDGPEIPYDASNPDDVAEYYP